MKNGFLTEFFNKHIDPLSPVYEHDNKWRYIPPRVVKITHIPVEVKNENDWEFEVVDFGNGVKKLAVL